MHGPDTHVHHLEVDSQTAPLLSDTSAEKNVLSHVVVKETTTSGSSSSSLVSSPPPPSIVCSSRSTKEASGLRPPTFFYLTNTAVQSPSLLPARLSSALYIFSEDINPSSTLINIVSGRNAHYPPFTSTSSCSSEVSSATATNVYVSSSHRNFYSLLRTLIIRQPPIVAARITPVQKEKSVHSSTKKSATLTSNLQPGRRNTQEEIEILGDQEVKAGRWDHFDHYKIHPRKSTRLQRNFCHSFESGFAWPIRIGDLISNLLLRKFCTVASCSNETNSSEFKNDFLSNKTKSSDSLSVAKKSPKGSVGQSSQELQSTTPSLAPTLHQVPPVSGNLPEDTETATDSLKMKEEMQLEFILKSLVAGGVAGMCAKTTVAPLDRMKILLQAHSKHYSHLGVFSGLRGIVQKERFLALYKGNGAQMVRIFPYAATQFTSFEMYKKLFGEQSHVARFAAGSAAGVTAVALTYPLDTIRARLAFQVTGEHVYSGIYSCAVHIFREEGGIRALYRGFIPTVCGMIPYAGLSFYCFESFKYVCMKHFPIYTCKTHSTNTGGLVLLLYAKLICGGVAGAAAQTVSYPLDVTRRRMQLAMMDERTKKFGMGMVSTIKLIYQENGVVRGLYRGMSINYLRAIPMVAVSFSTYELVKQMLNLDTGLPIKTG